MQLPQLRLAEELAQLGLVHGEGLRAPLGQRRVAVVEVVGDVAEEQRRREGRGRLRVHGDEPDLAAADAGGDLHEPRQVEDVAQALAVGLEHDREGRVARGHLQQVVGALPLHPERRPLARPAPRQEKRPGRRLPEARGEEARAPELADHEVLDLLGLGQEVRGLRRALALGQAEDDPVVAPDRLDLGLARLPQARLEGGRPRRVDAAAPRARGGRAASPPSRRASARARSCGRRAARRSPRAGRRGRRGGSARPAGRGRGRAAGARWPRPGLAPGARGSGGRWRGPAPPAAPPRSAFQNGILPGSPGAGTTSTRSRVISVIRQLVAPRTKTSPTRLSKTISSSSSPTRSARPVPLRRGRRRRARGREWCRRSARRAAACPRGA